MSEGGFHDHPDSRGVFVEMWTIDLLEGDLSAALLLSQLLWWHQPSKDGTPRVKYERGGHWWLLRPDDGWYDECRMTTRQVRRARSVLVSKGLIEHRRFKLAGAPTSAWRPLYESIQTEVRNFRTSLSASLPTDASASLPIPCREVEEDPAPVGAGKPKARKWSETADRLARDEWDSRNPKPISPFIAVRERVQELLDAGHTEGELRRVLPSVTVWTRGGIEMALAKAQPARPQVETYDHYEFENRITPEEYARRHPNA